jgi:hypothetical protein
MGDSEWFGRNPDGIEPNGKWGGLLMARFGAARFDTGPMRLDALRKRSEQFAANERAIAELALSAADHYGEKREDVRAGRYDRDRTNEELATARAAARDAFVAVLADADRVTAANHDDARERFDLDVAARTRTARRLADVVDVTRLRESEHVAEIVGLLRTAETFGDEVAAQARAVALPTLRQLAAHETRLHRQGGPAFAALCDASARPSAPMNRGDLAARYRHRNAQLRAFVLDVAAACGFDERELVGVGVTAPMPDDVDVKPNIVFGRYWER